MRELQIKTTDPQLKNFFEKFTRKNKKINASMAGNRRP